MNSNEKTGVISHSVLQGLVNAFAIGIILFAIIAEKILNSDDKTAATIAIPTALLISGTIQYLHTKNSIEKLEAAYKNKDSNYFADH